jgi:hypothetical protein
VVLADVDGPALPVCDVPHETTTNVTTAPTATPPASRAGTNARIVGQISRQQPFKHIDLRCTAME